MVIIILLCTAVLALHHRISRRFPAKASTTASVSQGAVPQPPHASARVAPVSATPVASQHSQAIETAGHDESVNPAANALAGSCDDRQCPQATADTKPSVNDSLRFLARSPQIQCLGIMSLSQGLTTNLLDLAWKTHLHMLHPSPTAYAVCVYADILQHDQSAGSSNLHMPVSPAIFTVRTWIQCGTYMSDTSEAIPLRIKSSRSKLPPFHAGHVQLPSIAVQKTS